MRFKQEEVSKIPVYKGLTPIRINITCVNYERKTLKQDSFNLR